MKEKNSTLFKVLTVIMILGIVTAGIPVSASAAEIKTSAPLTGDGSAEAPYEISSKEELYWFAQLIDGDLEGIAQNEKANAVLVNDITVNEKVLENGELVSDVSGLIKWMPIGYKKEYDGVFDGKGHTISGLYCDSGSKFAGVFSRAARKIMNLNVADSYFKSANCTGGICGYSGADIYNCHVSARLKNTYDDVDGIVGGIVGKAWWGDIRSCSFSGIAEGREYVGGICGKTEHVIRDCINRGTVTGDTYVGGISGLLSDDYHWDGTNRNYNTGDITGRMYVGGLFGSLDYNVSIYNSYNAGKVTATESCAGGFCGTNEFSELSLNSLIYNCYNSGDVYAPVYSGGMIGQSNGVYGDNNYYLKGSAKDGGGYEQTAFGKGWVAAGGGTSYCVSEMTQEDLESGAITYILQKAQEDDELVWGQIEYSTGSHPILTNNETYRVEKYTNLNGTTIYISGGTGDFDNDKVIDEIDYENIIKSALGEADTTDETIVAKSDVNADGVVDVLDVALLERKLSK